MKDEMKRKDRFIIVSWLLLLLIIVGLTTWASVEIRNLKSEIQLAISKQPTVIKGIDGREGLQGVQGVSGINGLNGSNGVNGQSVTPEQIATAVSQYLQANPPASVQGPPGKDGVNGKSIQIELDPVTCSLQSKYDDSDSWNILAIIPGCGVAL